MGSLKTEHLARAISLALAVLTSLVGLLVPFLLARRLDAATHAALSLMMLGLAGAFVHGLGFRPRSAALAVLFSPSVAWPLILGPILWLAS
jgi:predicted membrane protein